MLTKTWLMRAALCLFVLGCATGEEVPPDEDGTEDNGGASDPPVADAATDSSEPDDFVKDDCPSEMVRIPAGADTYCVDAMEVTNEDFAKFLAAKPSVKDQPSECQWKKSFEPNNFPAATGEEKHPVVGVDWCDAHAYCAWAGKNLCGQIGGGSLPPAALDDPKKSQWFNACSQGGARRYPYGGTYDEEACNGLQYGAFEAIAVGSAKECEGGLGGLFDMSGNVLEWENSCEGKEGQTDPCLLRGGSYQSDRTSLLCSHPEKAGRSQRSPTIGFRCCRG